MISDTIRRQVQEAMKAKDELRVSTLKLLSSALSYEKIALQHELTDQEEMVVVRREVKKRNDAVTLYRKGNAEEKAAKEEAEIKILKEFLPEEMEDAELEKLVLGVIGEIGNVEIKDTGRIIGMVKERSQGRADGGKIAEMVKEKTRVR